MKSPTKQLTHFCTVHIYNSKIKEQKAYTYFKNISKHVQKRKV